MSLFFIADCYVWDRKERIQFLVFFHPHDIVKLLFYIYIKILFALAGAAQWIGRRPANQKVAGLIPSQGTCLGCSPGPWLEACKRLLIDVSFPLFLLPFSFL